MSVACTFSGKYGDILWSLPTAREISRIWDDEPVHFYVMPHYGDICELITQQPYIASAQPLEGWELDNWGCGAQPWYHPELPDFERVFDLTYQKFPQGSLVDFIARQQNIKLPRPLPPFITVPHHTEHIVPYDIAFGFSDKYGDVKMHFQDALVKGVEHAINRPLRWVHTTAPGWLGAAEVIARSTVFVGERSSNHVIAHGLGKPVVEYEIDTTRHNPLFSFPYSDAPCYCPSEPETFELFKHLATCIMNENKIDHPIMERYVGFIASLLR